MADGLDRLTWASLRLRGYRSESVPTAEGQVHVLVAKGGGELPPMAFLHGFGSASMYYGPLLRRLRGSTTRIVAPDMPAHGFSEPPRSGMRPDVLLGAIFEALDAQLREPAIVVGNSMGGYAAVRYATERPDRVRGLVLCSPAGAVTEDEEELEQVRELFRMDDHRRALAFVDRLTAKTPPLRHLMAWGMRRRFAQTHLRELIEGIKPEEGLDPGDIGALSMPVLFVWGEEEKILPPSHLSFWRTHLPSHAQIEQPKGMGHSPFLDRPRALAERILTFARDIPVE